MFKIFGFQPDKKIDIQLKVFLKWRVKRGMSIVDYEQWIVLFISRTKRDDVQDVTAMDLLEFVEYVREAFNNSQFYIRRAEIALRQFKRFYSARDHIMKDIADYNRILYSEGVNFVSDVNRNKKLVELRLKDPAKWTFRALGDHFNIHWTRAKQVFDQNLNKYSH